MTTSEAIFNIAYDGLALQSSEMEVRQLAPALHAVGEVLEAANKVLNGDQIKLSIRVRGSFKSGCFGIDFALTQSLWKDALTFFSTPDVVAAVTIINLLGLSGKDGINSLIGLIKWIKNRKISKVVEIEDSKIKIIIDDDFKIVEDKVLKLLEDYSVRKALSGVIYDPLETDGIDKFAAGSEKDGLVVVEKKDAVYFSSPIIQDRLLHESIYETMLQLVSLSFHEDNKWRVSEGGNGSFLCDITDTEFNSKVQKNEIAFAKDDLLRVNLRKRQWLTEKGTMRMDYIIEKVIEHKSAAIQLKLDIY